MERFRKPICAIVVGGDAGLAAAVAWSMPMEAIGGFLLVGWSGLRELRRLPGCRGHVQADVDVAGPELWDRVLAKAAGAQVAAVGADELACQYISRYGDPRIAVMPVAPVETQRLLGDKWAFHQLCGRLALPTPRTEYFPDKAAIAVEPLLARLGERVVVKATGLKAGVGMAIVDGPADLRRQVTENPSYSYAPLVAQTFIDGADIGVSVLAQEGRVLHLAVQSARGDRLRFLHHDALIEAATVLMRETAYSGFANIDARLRPDGGIALLECNPRPWGTMAKSAWAGLNFLRAGLAAAVGGVSGEPVRLTSGDAAIMGGFEFASLRPPWRLFRLTADQRRLLRADVASWLTPRLGRLAAPYRILLKS
jgi:predicted ATP-grasp superfamily ATP-dependent carboligase